MSFSKHVLFFTPVEMMTFLLYGCLIEESLSIYIQGGDSGAGTVLCWHPYLDILAVATNTAIVEYDAVSGCRMNMVDCDGSPVKLRYTLDGQYLVLLTRVRYIDSENVGMCCCP